jgi:hypothetical protein
MNGINLDIDSCGSLLMSGWRFCAKRISPRLFLTLAVGLALAGEGQAGLAIQPGSSPNVSVSGGPGNKNDWVGLFRVGAPADGFNTMEWCYLSGTKKELPAGKTATEFPFVLPKNLSARQYEFHFYATDQYFRLLATHSQSVPVGSARRPSPHPPQAGSEETITVSGGTGRPNDWVRLYRVGAPSDEAQLLAWSYLNGTQKSPATGKCATTFSFIMPSNLSNLSPGLNEFRFYANDDFHEKLAISQMTKVGSGAHVQIAP